MLPAFLAGRGSFAAAEAHRHRPQRQQGTQDPLRVILNGLGKDAAQIISTSTASPMYRRVRLLHRQAEDRQRDPLLRGGRACRCCSAGGIPRGALPSCITRVSMFPSPATPRANRFQHPVAGTYKKRCIEQGKSTSLSLPAAPGRTLHPDGTAAGPASYGMTDTMGRMHSDAQFTGFLLCPGSSNDARRWAWATTPWSVLPSLSLLLSKEALK